MGDYEAETYGERIAGIYDDLHAWHLDTESAVEALAGLAGEGPILELGVGTGRIAIPLAERGIEVHGIDASEAMVAKLRGKPGGDRVHVTMGDFADVPIEGRFTLVFVVFNTIFALPSQEDQVRCFRNVAARLKDDGIFVVEAFVPDVARFDRGQRVDAARVETDRLVLEVSNHDPVDQRVVSHHVVAGDEGVRLYPVEIRYVWPSEMDLMARVAGLGRRARWSGWRKEPFTASSARHISVYERA